MPEFLAYMIQFTDIVKSRGYFPSVFLAQSILESGWGRSPLSRVWNYWGHKWKPDCGFEYTGKTSNEEINGEMIPVRSRFRAYRCIDEAIEAYCDKWEESWQDGLPKYRPDFSSPAAFIESVAETYATDSNYASKILRIIDELELTQYD